MAKTNSERQAEYRSRHLKDVEGTGDRLNTVLDSSAKLALKRLSHHSGLTQKEILERLLKDEEARLISTLTNIEQDKYYDCK